MSHPVLSHQIKAKAHLRPGSNWKIFIPYRDVIACHHSGCIWIEHDQQVGAGQPNFTGTFVTLDSLNTNIIRSRDLWFTIYNWGNDCVCFNTVGRALFLSCLILEKKWISLLPLFSTLSIAVSNLISRQLKGGKLPLLCGPIVHHYLILLHQLCSM